MKPNTFFVATIAFAATIATIGTTAASLLPARRSIVTVWVRRVEANPPGAGTLNVSAGTHDLDLNASGVDVVVKVNDTTTPPAAGQDYRKGRFNQGGPDGVIKTVSAVVITPTSTVTVP